MTYGGWTQCRALGARIASLLHAREDTATTVHNTNTSSVLHNNHPDEDSPSPFVHFADLKQTERAGRKNGKRKHKVVIHSSPFLRCVQTSVAISAGISQFEGSQQTVHTASGARPRSRTPTRYARSRSPPALAAIPEPETRHQLRSIRNGSHEKPQIPKSTLRIDAFLGEWLSPDYFDLITPPPNSTMMVAGAKADLLRRGDYVEAPHVTVSSSGHFPGGWTRANSVTSAKGSTKDDGPLSTLSSLSHSLPPLRERASSHSSVGSTGSRSSQRGATSISAKPDNGVYTALTPSYAVSPADPIPRGYVAHARDACVDVDYQWDSMREPQEWGDGGEYGEEWSSMHKRFRKGINSMVEWYKEHGVGDPGTDQWCAIDDGKGKEDEDEEETDLVVVLVTHGAGCNALIGALTNQPVLLDLGMASLTMAVCRDHPVERRSSSPVLSLNRPKEYVDSHLSEFYEMRLLASTEHLRPGFDATKIHHLPSPKIVPVSDPFQTRRRYFSNSAAHGAAGSPIDAPFHISEPVRPAISAALGSIRRNSTTPTSSSSRNYSTASNGSASPTGLAGLWSKPANAAPALNLDGGTESASNENHGESIQQPPESVSRSASVAGVVTPITTEATVGPAAPRQENTVPSATAPATTTTASKPSPSLVSVHQPPAQTWTPAGVNRSLSQHGLWGSKPLGISNERHERDRGPKRRWTVNEREA